MKIQGFDWRGGASGALDCAQSGLDIFAKVKGLRLR
jgi:hypothetical protein